jgi:hypothetical protein
MFKDWRVFLLLAVAIGLWVPLANLEWFWGHEQASYVLRTVEFATELRAGELYPRWCPDFYGGYGSPLFIFYGPVIYALAGFMTATFLSPFVALKVVVLLGSILSGLGTYALIHGETRDRDASLLGAMLFMAAPYRIGNLYDRGDLGEFSCLSVLPFAIFLYRAAAREPLPERATRLAVGASVVHAIVIMTHPVLGLWGTIVIGSVTLATVIALARRRAYRRVALLVSATACAPLLAGVYLVPAMAYRDITHTAGMIVGFYNPQDHWLLFKTLFVASTPLFLRNFLQIGPVLTVAAFAALLALVVNYRLGKRTLGWAGLTTLIMLLTQQIGSGFWAPNRIPLAPFIQFPWRLLGPSALLAAVVLGVAAAALFERLRESTRSAITIVCSAGFIFLIAWPFVSSREMPYAGVTVDSESIRQAMVSATDANEYLPGDAKAPPSAPSKSIVRHAEGATLEDSTSRGSKHELVLKATRSRAGVHLALHGFPGWSAETLDGPASVKLSTDDHGLLYLRLPAAGTYRVRVWFGVTPAGYVGGALSMLGAAVLAFLWLRASRFWPLEVPAVFARKVAA